MAGAAHEKTAGVSVATVPLAAISLGLMVRVKVAGVAHERGVGVFVAIVPLEGVTVSHPVTGVGYAITML